MCMCVSLTIATQLVFDNWIKLQQAERDQSANNGVMCIRPNYAFYGLKPSCCLLFLICNGAVGDRVPPFPTTQFKLFDFIHKYKYLHYSLKFWAILPLSSRFTRAFHQWRFTNGVTSAAIRNESPPGEVSVQRHFDSFLFTNIVCASCSSSTQSTRDLHARLLRASRMRTRMKTRRGGGRRVVNGFCRGATIPAISICDNQIMRSSPRADYQFVPFNFMLINSPRFLLFFSLCSHLRKESNEDL